MFLCTGHAMPRPRYGFQPLLLQFLFAFDACAVRVGSNTLQRVIDQRQHGPVGIRLPEQEFFGIRVRSFVSKINCRIIIRGPTFFFGPRNRPDQFLAAGLQFFLIIIHTLLIHSRAPLFTQLPV